MSETEDDAVASLITSVYRDVWEEFYTWDHDYATAAILSLQHNKLTDLSADSSRPQPAKLCTPRSFFSGSVLESNILRWVYPNEEVERRHDSMHMMDYKIVHRNAPKIDPFPAYESCSPITTNVFVGDDCSDMPFVPFPGSMFDFYGYQYLYDDFVWLNPELLDPDAGAIALESIRRLDIYHDVPVEAIKRILLPDVPISKLEQGDLLQWLSLPTLHDEIPKSSSIPERSNLKARLDCINRNFCPNLNCIETFCSFHETVPPIGPADASGENVLGRVPGPCSPACFISAADTSTLDYEVEEDMRNTIITILSVCPDLTTCQLAVACRRTCRETYDIRQKLNSLTNGNHTQQRIEPGVEAMTNFVIAKLDNFSALDYEPDLPCQHEGPCDSSAACPCHRIKSYCEKSCRCSPKCIRRFRGCKCKSKRKSRLCTTESCACYNAGRECDPEVCLSCKASDLPGLYTGGPCFNSQIQRGKSKRTLVKRGKYGMGLFLQESASSGDLILEYTGEIIFESTTSSRNFFNIFGGRSYFYGLTGSTVVDARKLGNESRFINHDEGRVNCRAKYLLVNGVKRIGIFATKNMKLGTELFLNYGDEFFVDDQ